MTPTKRTTTGLESHPTQTHPISGEIGYAKRGNPGTRDISRHHVKLYDMITIVELQAKIEAAVADFEAGLYQSAITKALSAGMLLVGIPDTQFDITDQVRFDRRSAREQIDALVKNSRMMLNSQSGPAESPVRYERG